MPAGPWPASPTPSRPSSFDAQAAAEAATVRVRSAERLRDAVTKALGELHALLDPEQRARLAYLIRTGTLQV